MARKDQHYETEFHRPQRGRRRGGKLKFGLGLLTIALVLLLIFLPSLVARPSVLVPLIDRFAGLAPLKVDLAEVQAGWFKPVSLGGIQLLDGEGKLLAKIAEVETSKGLWSWISQSQHLGSIRLHGVEAAVAAGSGTTNIEQALQPILENLAASDPQAQDALAAQALPTGSIEIVDSKFLLMQVGRPEQWIVALPKVSLALPTAGQVIGPIELQANIADVSGTHGKTVGSIAASVAQAKESQVFELRAKLEDIPVNFWHVLHARFPEIPIDELQGRVTAVVSGNIADANRWSFDVQQVESYDLRLVAPALVGPTPAQIAFASVAGRASLTNNRLRVEGAQLKCDFAQATATASLAWPLAMPTAAQPFVSGSTFEASGAVDLPKLVQAAQSLIPIREDTRLVAGQARFTIAQQLDAQGTPASRAALELSGLQAQAAGQQLNWNDPLSVDVSLNDSQAGLQVAARATAEFCSLQAGGSLQRGQVGGHVDLEMLHQRLSQYVQLPIQTMSGAADLDMTWQMAADEILTASGTLKTTPMRIVAEGDQIEEPAWNGEFSATGKLAGGTPDRIEKGQLTLKARDEQLTFDLQGPLALNTPVAGQASLAPAPFSFNLVGDLANWKRRGTFWLSEPPDLSIAGSVSLAAGGVVDIQHAEVLEANWRMQPLQLVTTQLSLAEPQMVGNFKGRVDTNNLTRLVVEKLEVQATSFSLGARDAAGPEGSNSRVGQAMFLVDLDRLLKNVQSQTISSAPTLAVAAASPSTRYSATGRVQGQMAWQVSPSAAAVEVRADGENITLLSQAPSAIAPVPFWDEPRATAAIKGNWLVETSSANVENMQLQLPWLNYAGNLTYRAVDQASAIGLKGQAVYDSVALSNKLAPLTGNQLQLFGQQTVPIEMTWTSPSDPQASALSGLTALTRIGWEQARVAGIQLGKADVPVKVEAGNLATAAEFPVSGGVLRWDITSDLTANDLVILQKPMTVLENVAITPEMCQGWLKYVTPLLAEATSIDGRLSLQLQEARLTPADPKKQNVAGRLVMHNVTVGPGPLSNQVIGLVKQIDAVRKKDYTQPVSSAQRVWMNMPEQQIDFQMADGRVVHRNVNVRVGDASISTSGSVSVDGQLEMLATMPIPDDWIDKSPLLAGMRGQSLNFPVNGTISKPQLDAQGLQQFGRQAVQSAASGLIQQQLNRGLGKLFGTPPPAAAPTTPPATTPQ